MAIALRLEAARQYGLLDDYKIEWRQKSLCPPRVTIQGRQRFPLQITKNYVTRLLDLLVPSRAISVTQNKPDQPCF